MENTKTVKALKKQLVAAIAMVLVAAVALGSSTYAWFVSNNSVKGTTTTISAQSNAPFLKIDNVKVTAASGTEKTLTEPTEDTKLYPSQVVGDATAPKFESAYAKDKSKADELTNSRFEVGNAEAAVTGRMRWNEPSPTMTTQCIGYGNGRFGHPEQDRAISAREAALFQTFPKSYKFFEDEEHVSLVKASRYIGNAVPPVLGEVVADSIIEHLKNYF